MAFYSNNNVIAVDEAAKQIECGQVVIKTLDEFEAIEKGIYIAGEEYKWKTELKF